MKKLVLSLLTLTAFIANSQSWQFVGNESFTPPYCSSAQLANYGPLLSLVVDPYDDANSTNYLHPYQFDGTDWNIYLDSINHPIFTTYDLMQDIESNSTNEHFILCFGGPNKTYLYQSDLGNQEWDLVDSFLVNCDDLEIGLGGNMWASGYGGIFEHQYGTGGHTTFSSPAVYGSTKMTMNDATEPIFMHAGPSNSYEISDNNGSPFNELDSINYGSGIWGYDVGMSEDKVVSVHLHPITEQIVLKKQNGASWDAITVNPSMSYDASDVVFNLTENPADGTIYLAVHHAFFAGGTTDMTIRVFEISADLATINDLGEAVNYTVPMTALPLKYDLEFDQNKLYCSYINVNDSSKASVKTYDLATSDVEEESSIEFGLYPNPTTDQFYLNTSLNEYQLDLLDVSGKVILTAKESGSSSVNVEDLTPGVYFVRVASAGKQAKVKKLILR